MSEEKELPSPSRNDYFYPTLCSMVDRDVAEAIHCLAMYVRPDGDWSLVRSDLDLLDRAFEEIEAILRHKYNGQIWSKR